MAAKQLSKNLLSRPCHINSVIHFVRGADPFQIKTVSGSLALSAHSEAGLPEINLWVIHSTTLLKAQTLLDQSQGYITKYLNSQYFADKALLVPLSTELFCCFHMHLCLPVINTLVQGLSPA